MKSIKIILTAFLLLALTLGVNATGGIKLYVKIKSTEKLEGYLLADKPVVTFDGQNVQIKTADVEISTPYTYADIEKFYFDVVQDEIIEPDTIPDDPTDNIEKEDAVEKVSFEFAYDGRVAQIKGLGEAPKVAVFNTAGVQAQPRTVITSNAVTITMSELPAGIYVIRANDRSFKIIKK